MLQPIRNSEKLFANCFRWSLFSVVSQPVSVAEHGEVAAGAVSGVSCGRRESRAGVEGV